MVKLHEPIHVSLRQEYLKKISELREQYKEHITTSAVADREYVERVGLIQGMKISQEIFEEVFEMYFPKH